MSGISFDRLQGIVANYEDNDTKVQLFVRDGVVGEHAARINGHEMENLKITNIHEDDTVKQQQYGEAKDAVLQAIVGQYGREIGEKAFRAGISRATSKEYLKDDEPINSRHIQAILKAAADEIELSDVGDWMDSFCGNDGRGSRQIVRGASISEQSGKHRKDAFGEVAHAIRMDSESQWENSSTRDGHAFWLVEVKRTIGKPKIIAVHKDVLNLMSPFGLKHKRGSTSVTNLRDGLMEICGKNAIKRISVHRIDGQHLGENVDVKGLEVRSLAFESSALVFGDGTEIAAPLDQLFGKSHLAKIDQSYQAFFGQEELNQTKGSEYLSPTIEDQLEQGIPQSQNARDYNGQYRLLIPSFGNEDERRLTVRESKYVTRFLNGGPFIALYDSTCRAMNLGEEESDSNDPPTVWRKAEARRDENGNVMIDISFWTDLPTTPDGKTFELNYKVSVPLDEIDSEEPEVEFHTPWLKLKLEAEEPEAPEDVLI